MSRETVIKSLHPSVARLYPGLAGSVKEALICVGVAERTCGSRAALLVASEIYKMPVQYSGECSLDDLLWFVEGKVGRLIYDRGRESRGKGCVGNGRRARPHNPGKRMGKGAMVVDKFKATVGEYEVKLKEAKGLPNVGGRTKVSLADEEEFYEKEGSSRFKNYSVGCWWENFKKDTEVFPKKENKGVVKQNIRFDDLWCDVRMNYPKIAYLVGTDRHVLDGMYNDEAVGWLMWMCGAFNHMGERAIAFCKHYGLCRTMLKEINTYAKSLGLQRYGWGLCVCELITLEGRGVHVDPPSKDIVTRIDTKSFLKDKAAVCDRARLTRCIKEVLKRELATKPTWKSPDDYWTRRWLYTKSGSHSKYPEERIFGERLGLPTQPTRREFAEVCSENVIAKGEPRVDCGHSYKEEHGKTRHIYSCDTVSYFTFDYLLRPIESVWRNKRVLLDPGRELQSTRYDRLRRISGCRYMLDFDDFNSQHTQWAMKEVCELAFEGAPPEVKDWAVRSWSNTYVHWLEGDNMREELMVGTLPSGHRATTFINTVLNAAYCFYASDDMMRGLESYHCGDDVIVFGPENKISQFITNVTASPFRVNPSKQSVGFEVGEFLRVAFTRESASGYGARGISSMVSGNWVTEHRLDKKSYVETMLRGLWTVAARFDSVGLGILGKTSLRRRVPELAGWHSKLCMHEVSWAGSPVARVAHGKPVIVIRPSGGVAKFKTKELKQYSASRDFLENHIDFTLLESTDYTPGQLMRILRQASEKPRELTSETDLQFTIERTSRWNPAELSTILALRSRGERNSMEAVNILQRMLTKVDWTSLVGVVRNVSPGYIRSEISPWPVVSMYTLPHSDLMSVRRRLSCTTKCLVNYPVRV
jgi:hypothetical protein